MDKRTPINEIIVITDLLSEDEWKEISKTDESVNKFLGKYGWTLEEFEREFVNLLYEG